MRAAASPSLDAARVRRRLALAGLLVTVLLMGGVAVSLVSGWGSSHVVEGPDVLAVDGDGGDREPLGLGEDQRRTLAAMGVPLAANVPPAPPPSPGMAHSGVGNSGMSSKERAGAAAGGLAPPGDAPEGLTPEEELPKYSGPGELRGELRIVGSDRAKLLLTYLAEAFTAIHPDVTIVVEGNGSASAPPALVTGAADLAVMQREMTARESRPFSERFGYPPLGMRIAFESVAVLVHPSNQVERMSLAELDAMFSTTRKRGFQKDVATWGALGVAGELGERRIELFGRNSASAMHGWFKEWVLAKGDYKPSVKEQPGSAAVREAVANEPAACGYAPAAARAEGVRVVPILADDGRAVLPTPAEIRSGQYPISRPLWLYVNRKPGDPLPPNVRAFLLFAFSREGRAVIDRDLLTPHSRRTAEVEREKVL